MRRGTPVLLSVPYPLLSAVSREQTGWFTFALLWPWSIHQNLKRDQVKRENIKEKIPARLVVFVSMLEKLSIRVTYYYIPGDPKDEHTRGEATKLLPSLDMHDTKNTYHSDDPWSQLHGSLHFYRRDHPVPVPAFAEWPEPPPV